jgi:hypothetical protein
MVGYLAGKMVTVLTLGDRVIYGRPIIYGGVFGGTAAGNSGDF